MATGTLTGEGSGSWAEKVAATHGKHHSPRLPSSPPPQAPSEIDKGQSFSQTTQQSLGYHQDPCGMLLPPGLHQKYNGTLTGEGGGKWNGKVGRHISQAH